MKKIDWIPIGSFEFESGEVTITDPCYYQETPSTDVNVKTGTWLAYIGKTHEGDWGYRVSYLIAYHKDHPIELEAQHWVKLEHGTGVDSGQAGFFDIYYFNDPKEVKEEIPNPLTGENLWYDLCCHKTLSATKAGVIPFGVVSSSGFGDGYYAAYAKFQQEEATALGLDFDCLPPIFFLPEFLGEEKLLFELLQSNDLSALEAFLNKGKGIDYTWFLNYCLYTEKGEELKCLLEATGDSYGLDWSYLFSNGKNVFECIKWLLTNYPALKDIFYGICYKDLDDAMYWSSQLVEIGYKIRTLDAFELVNLAKKLSDDKVALIEFWAKQGLSFHSSDLSKEEIAVKFEKKPNIAAFFKENYDKYVHQIKEILDKQVRLINGAFLGFQGLVLKQNGNTLKLKLTVFGKETEVDAHYNDIELLD